MNGGRKTVINMYLSNIIVNEKSVASNKDGTNWVLDTEFLQP